MIPEGVYGHSVLARHVISRVLTEKVEGGYLTENEALTLARRLLHDNPKALFRLQA